jgi:hypothetical protein
MPFETAIHIQALTLKLLNIPNTEIKTITGIKRHTVNDYLNQAIKQDLDPNIRLLQILNHHIEDREYTRCLYIRTPENIDIIIAKVKSNHFRQKKTYIYITDELGFSEQIV